VAVRESRAPSAPLSMTGAGTCVVDVPAGRFEAEARSVNHRFLKVSLHLGPSLSSLETGIEERIRGKVERGHVTVTLRYTRSSKAAVASFRIDEDVAKAASKRLKALAKVCDVEGGLTLRDLLTVPGVVVEAGGEGLEAPLEKAATKALDGALEALLASRATEGRHLAGECRAILARIAGVVTKLTAMAPELPRTYRDRLQTRIAALLEGSGVAPDPAALAREVASFADRSDVAEELARLSVHLKHAEELLAAGGAVGRKLDFLVQEFHREANTLGSKSPDPAITALVIEVKADVERMREQVQNFE
jgi:uncharacterized protein (TIGR00255 family)